MNKSELIVEIINICDENARLKSELENLKNQSESKVACSDLVVEDKRILELAKIWLFEKCFYSYSSVTKRTNDDGEVTYTSFDNWYSNAFRQSDMPHNFAADEVKELTMELSKKEYAKKLAEAKKGEDE